MDVEIKGEVIQMIGKAILEDELGSCHTVTFGKFDNIGASEEFVNKALKLANEGNLTFNDLKLSLKLIDEIAERSIFNANSVRLSFTTDGTVGFHFRRER